VVLGEEILVGLANVKEVGVNGRLVISDILSRSVRWCRYVKKVDVCSYLLVGIVDKRMEGEW
jgi:hypothetical protein